MLPITGCHHSIDEENQISLGEWITMVVDESGIVHQSEEGPHYFNVLPSSSCYEAVQTAVDYEILDCKQPFKPEDALTKEWVAYTLVNLMDLPLAKDTNQIKDSGKSQFPYHICTSVSIGLFDLDKKERFYPEQIFDKHEASALLKQVVAWIDEQEFEENEAIVEFEEDPVELEEPTEFDEEKNVAVYHKEVPVEKNTIVRILTKQPPNIYKVIQVENKASKKNPVSKKDSLHQEPLHGFSNQKKTDKFVKQKSNDQISNEIKEDLTVEEVAEIPETKLYLEEIKDIEDLKEVDVQGSFDLDFSEAEIIDETSSMNVTKGFFPDENEIQGPRRAFKPKCVTKTVNGFKISYWVNKESIRVEVRKELPKGSKLFATSKIYGLRPSYDWKFSKGKIQRAYFRMDFKTHEAFGLRNGARSQLYGDINELKHNDFLTGLSRMFKPKEEMDSVVIPIATIRVPLPNAPMFFISTQLQIRIYATGRMEVNFNHNHSYGMDIRNGVMRMIREHDHKANAVIRSDASALTAVQFAFDYEK